jgi:hypothetical protein
MAMGSKFTFFLRSVSRIGFFQFLRAIVGSPLRDTAEKEGKQKPGSMRFFFMKILLLDTSVIAKVCYR